MDAIDKLLKAFKDCEISRDHALLQLAELLKAAKNEKIIKKVEDAIGIVIEVDGLADSNHEAELEYERRRNDF